MVDWFLVVSWWVVYKFLISNRFLGRRAMRRVKGTFGLLLLVVNPCSTCLKMATSDVAGAGGIWKSVSVIQQKPPSALWRAIITRPQLASLIPTVPSALWTLRGCGRAPSRTTCFKTPTSQANQSQRSSSALTTSFPLLIHPCLGSDPLTALFIEEPWVQRYMSWSPSTWICTSGLYRRRQNLYHLPSPVRRSKEEKRNSTRGITQKCKRSWSIKVQYDED